MKKDYLFRKGALIACVILTMGSCKKEEPEPNEQQNPTPQPEVSKFTWKENNGTEQVADSCFWTTGSWGTGIRAYKGGYANFFEINWSGENNISAGAKTLEFANYGFTFLNGSSTYTISANQTLTITSSSNNKLSGNFTASVTGGTISTIEGIFTAIEKK